MMVPVELFAVTAEARLLHIRRGRDSRVSKCRLAVHRAALPSELMGLRGPQVDTNMLGESVCAACRAAHGNIVPTVLFFVALVVMVHWMINLLS